MKKKIILAFFALTIITSTYAAQGTGYREYGEEYHSTPGANFHVEEVPIGTTAAMSQKKSTLNASTMTSVPNKNGRVNEYITVDGYHRFTISNNTHQRQTYETYVSLNCDNMHSYYRRYVDVDPGGYYTRDDHTFGTVQESVPGSYRIEGESKLAGESSDQSHDNGTLYITR